MKKDFKMLLHKRLYCMKLSGWGGGVLECQSVSLKES